MGVKSSNCPGHSTSNQVLIHICFHNGRDRRFESRSHHIFGNGSFNDDTFSTSLDPIHRGRLLIRAHVATQRNERQLGELLPKTFNDGETSFGNHVHSHCISRETTEANVHISPGHSRTSFNQLAKTGGRLKRLFELCKVVRLFNPKVNLSCFVCGGEANAGGAGDAVAEDGAAGPGSLGDGFASTVGACYETTLSSRHGNIHTLPIQRHRSHNSHRNRNIPHYNLAIRTEDSFVV
mmetsp:Transcript_18128/g.39136  ORF Transcript_18128/g.39136 Transcript_18128/m.39136 type:complete len:236 (-) Transcript_18128:1052-1759(-)